ncbi:MAG TPA: hypothetical protein VNJ08_08500 [Bacteriovoracaceae bacterium]|nr:hypothetical protein [Bacteriovoracaceae bacterium]
MGSITALAVKGFQDSKKKAEFQQAFPDKHIFQKIVIPPGKVIQRWILVQNPEEEPFSLKLQNQGVPEVILLVPGKLWPGLTLRSSNLPGQ